MIVGRSSGNHITGCAVAAAEYNVHQISQYIVNGADNAFALNGRCGNHGQQTGYKPGCAILAVRICHTNIQHTLDHIGVDQLFGIQSAFLCRIAILQHACNRQQLLAITLMFSHRELDSFTRQLPLVSQTPRRLARPLPCSPSLKVSVPA